MSIVTRQGPRAESVQDSAEEREPWMAPVAIGLLAVAAFALFGPVLFSDRTLFGRDITPFFYPMKHVLAESVRAGEIPWWNPGVVNGEPFFASLQPGLLYPGSVLLCLLPLSVSFDWLLALHYPLAGAGLFLLLRRWGHSAGAAWLGAAALMLGGYFVSLGNFPNNLQTVAWVPWLFWGWDKVLAGPSHRRIAAFAALCAIAFLGGEPQMLAVSLAWLFLHGALRVEGRATGLVRQSTGFAIAGGIAVAAVAVQLVPFVEFVFHSVRTTSAHMGYTASRSLEPAGLIHLVLPPVLNEGVHGFATRFIAATKTPWVLSPYHGVVVAGLAIVGMALARRRRALFWGLSALFGVLVALGANSPVYRFLFETVPVLRPFRYPEKFLLLPALAGAVLAATGADAAIRGGGRRMAVFLLAGFATIYATAGAGLVIAPGGLSTICAALRPGIAACEDPGLSAALYGSLAFRLAVLSGLAAAVAGMVGKGRLRPEAALGLLAMLTVADLLAAHSAVNPSVESEIYDRPAWPSQALDSIGADREAYRFRGTPHDAAMGSMVQVQGAYELSNLYLDFETMGPNVGQLAGWLHQDGLQGVELRSVALTNEASIGGWSQDPVTFLRAMNVRWYADPTLAADTLLGLRVAARHPDLPLRLFEVPEPLPRAYLVDAFDLATGPADALHRSLEQGFPLGDRVVLEETPEPVPTVGSGRVVAAEYGRNHVRIHVSTTGPMLLVLNDRWYPGWKARVDAADVPVLRAGGVFRAVAVPGGDSEVEFRFRPRGIGASAATTLLGLLAMLLMAGTRPGPGATDEAGRSAVGGSR